MIPQIKSKELIYIYTSNEGKKIKSNNFTRKNREKSNIANIAMKD